MSVSGLIRHETTTTDNVIATIVRQQSQLVSRRKLRGVELSWFCYGLLDIFGKMPEPDTLRIRVAFEDQNDWHFLQVAPIFFTERAGWQIDPAWRTPAGEIVTRVPPAGITTDEQREIFWTLCSDGMGHRKAADAAVRLA